VNRNPTRACSHDNCAHLTDRDREVVVIFAERRIFIARFLSAQANRRKMPEEVLPSAIHTGDEPEIFLEPNCWNIARNYEDEAPRNG
jgi:hypothetical protein